MKKYLLVLSNLLLIEVALSQNSSILEADSTTNADAYLKLVANKSNTYPNSNGFIHFSEDNGNLNSFFGHTGSGTGSPAYAFNGTLTNSITNSLAVNTPNNFLVGINDIVTAEFNSAESNFYGKVGIGTTDPSEPLHIYSETTNNVLKIQTDKQNGNVRLTMENDAQSWDIRTASDDYFYIVDGTASGAPVPFKIQPGAPTNTLFLKSSGNVGIGTSAATQKLWVEETEANVSAATLAFTSTTTPETGAAGLRIMNRETSDDAISAIKFQNIDPGGGGRHSAQIVSGKEAGWIAGNSSTYKAYLSFWTRPGGSQEERLRITSDGKVGIGRSNPKNKLHLSGNYRQTGSSIIFDNNDKINVQRNVEWDDGWKRINSDFGEMLQLRDGGLEFQSAANGSAGSAITWVEHFTVKSDGKVGIGATDPNSRLEVVGSYGDPEMILRSTDANPDLRFNAESQEKVGLLYDLNDNAFEIHVDDSGMDFTQHSLVIEDGGNVGIGTSSPRQSLDVRGSILANDVNTTSATSRNVGFYSVNDKAFGMELHYQSSRWGTAVFARDDSDIRFGQYAGNETQQGNLDVKMIVKHTGNVGIGTTTPDEKLTVKGKIHTEEVKVDLSVPAPDYVFEEEYDLPTLESIEKFIKSEKHLPEIPSAAEMEENGVELGTMNMLLLKKIEELTLYTLEQEKRINELVGGHQMTNDQLSQLEFDNQQLKIANDQLNSKLETLVKRIEKH